MQPSLLTNAEERVIGSGNKFGNMCRQGICRRISGPFDGAKQNSGGLPRHCGNWRENSNSEARAEHHMLALPRVATAHFANSEAVKQPQGIPLGSHFLDRTLVAVKTPRSRYSQPLTREWRGIQTFTVKSIRSAEVYNMIYLHAATTDTVVSSLLDSTVSLYSVRHGINRTGFCLDAVNSFLFWFRHRGDIEPPFV